MTSANVIEYNIYDKSGEKVGSHRQNVMCSTCNDGLLKYKPASDFTIQAWGYDEEEEIWLDENSQNLEIWLIKNPASYTHTVFQPGDKVKISKKKLVGLVKETIKDTFSHKYLVELPNGEIVEFMQRDLMYY
jgi:hypothetical protein